MPIHRTIEKLEYRYEGSFGTEICRVCSIICQVSRRMPLHRTIVGMPHMDISPKNEVQYCRPDKVHKY
jgi:hypothetical protein